MKLIIIILTLVILLIILYYCTTTTEKFESTISDNRNCCLIRKQRIGADLVYTYNKSMYCDNYHTNLLRTIKEGILINKKPFTMDNCTADPEDPVDTFGSCRKPGWECIDFQTESDCKKYPGLVWSEKTCNDQIPYVPHYDSSFGQPGLDVPEIKPLFPLKM